MTIAYLMRPRTLFRDRFWPYLLLMNLLVGGVYSYAAGTQQGFSALTTRWEGERLSLRLTTDGSFGGKYGIDERSGGGTTLPKGPNETEARATVRIQRIDYHGWAGAYRLSNQAVELVFVPQIGRIMRYGYIGGKNVLWENPKLAGKTTDFSRPVTDWNNYGGDKLWPAPQAKWGWPPDPLLESSEQAVQILPGNRLLVTSQPSKTYGLRFIREIAFNPTGTGVTLRNVMVATGQNPVTWSVWEVTQVDDPAGAYLPLHRSARFPQGYIAFSGNKPEAGHVTIQAGKIRFRRQSARGAKIGAAAPAGWIRADWPGLQVEVSASYEAGQDYPDGGCAQEIWSNGDPDRYMEMELLSPIHTLKPGERYAFTTRWRLGHASVH